MALGLAGLYPACVARNVHTLVHAVSVALDPYAPPKHPPEPAVPDVEVDVPRLRERGDLRQVVVRVPVGVDRARQGEGDFGGRGGHHLAHVVGDGVDARHVGAEVGLLGVHHVHPEHDILRVHRLTVGPLVVVEVDGDGHVAVGVDGGLAHRERIVQLGGIALPEPVERTVELVLELAEVGDAEQPGRVEGEDEVRRVVGQLRPRDRPARDLGTPGGHGNALARRRLICGVVG